MALVEQNISKHDAKTGIVWKPSREYIRRSRLWRFMRRYGIKTFQELLSRSNEDPEWFWDAVVKDLKLEWYKPYTRVMDTSRGIPWTRWFVGGRYNYVHDALDKQVETPKRNKLAFIWEGEDGQVRKLTYWEVWAETNRLAHALKSLGIGKGDRVGIFMPMTPEVAVATLACSKIGAIYIPIFSGYGPGAVVSRLQASDARILITADGFYRRGQVAPMKDVADAAADDLPGLEHVLVYRRMGNDVSWKQGRDIWWHEAVAGKPRTYATEQTEAEDPFMIIYTSGTTGAPKGALHVHGGFPVKGVQDMAHCFDVQEDDILFWITDIGWMMGPWAIAGATMLGSTFLMYEGAPDYPNPDRLWEMVERHGVTIMGISPTAVRSLMVHGDDLVKKHDLSTLRILGSTGEPWNPEPWMWFFRNVGGGRCPIINYSGGTEISGGIICGNPISPVKPCAFVGPIPGMDADVVDEHGMPVRGQVGELILRKPWPGMTRGFWKAPQRYLDTYWSRWPDIWVHGDWALVDEDGFWFIQGRSDDTIKLAGKRVGPAEVESAVVAHPAVAEAAAIGVPDEKKGEALVCFVVLRPGHEPSDELRQGIKEAVVRKLGKTLRPAEVRFVKELPKTRNAKVMRRLIRAKYLKLEQMGDTSALEEITQSV
ncbi:MAG: acetate--CoA ligase [Dehalococcoidia bacterium]|nr:acetate--CoA ligase [Dehalococcoidia bacterium]